MRTSKSGHTLTARPFRTHMRISSTLLGPSIAALAGFAFIGHVAVAKRTRDEDQSRQRRRIVLAMDSERIRIQRDLHDTAQQRIVSLRIRLGILAEEARLDRSAVATLTDDLDAALAEIRAVTASTVPELLLRDGLPAALRSAAARAPLRVVIDSPNLGRLAPQIERQVYFCCLEGLQNVFKHSSASNAFVRLRRRAGRLGFEIVDDGRGFDPSRVTMGQGLRNIAFRLASLEGRLSVVANEGQGTRLRGEVPIAEPSADRRRMTTAVQLRARSAQPVAPGQLSWAAEDAASAVLTGRAAWT